MALALYRKYRPRTFAEVIGQEHVTEPLSQALRSGRLHHAYLFSGPRGCGKTSSARILARSLNCEQGPTPEPCGVCASCKSLANDGAGSIDVIEIDAASHGGVDDARDLREKAFFAPASSRYKIYVIDEAHMVSSAGFNALLKLVEEPPDYVKFIFATTEPEKVLGTIRSRTHHYPFRLIPPAVLRPYLQQLTEAEGVHVDPAVLPLVVRAGGGSARDTLSVLDQLISGSGPEGVSYPRAVSLLGVTDVALIDEMCDALAAGDGAAAYQTIDRVAEAGHDPRRFASDLLERFRDLIVLQQVPDAVSKGLIDGPADQLEQMGAQATRLGPATLSRCADIVHNGLVEMRGTTAPRLLLELITARMLLPGADDANNALLQRLERMERRLTLSADEVRPEPTTAAQSPAPGGGGISAARAAAAAAGRRAPAGGVPSGSVSGPASSGPAGGAVAPVSSAGVGSAAPVSAVPGAAAPVSAAGPAAAAMTSAGVAAGGSTAGGSTAAGSSPAGSSPAGESSAGRSSARPASAGPT
ncbi:DNA polymerase III subunit gamma and tau, partial [Actinoplanes sp. NPDC048791]|uniref:DNA polymerase III subunit gamma and tau n=1 Tax=Actinoplanes sp. NPDC048791 TaxID=3154623 RepID=UPI0033F8128E